MRKKRQAEQLKTRGRDLSLSAAEFAAAEKVVIAQAQRESFPRTLVQIKTNVSNNNNKVSMVSSRSVLRSLLLLSFLNGFALGIHFDEETNSIFPTTSKGVSKGGKGRAGHHGKHSKLQVFYQTGVSE